MTMSIWDILLYIYRWKYMIIACVIACALFMNYYISNNQTYSARTIIKYSSTDAEAGLTATGKVLNVYEIISPHVITAAIKDLNLKQSAEFIRSNISVTPIIPSDQKDIKEAKIKANEEYSYTPVYYMISFTVGKSFHGTYARDVLDAVIKNYYAYYSEAHIRQSVLPEIISTEDIFSYDYLEIAELMESKVEGTMSYLKEKSSSMPEFRSSATGMSFADLIKEYRQLKDFVLPTLMSDILHGQITKNKEVLIKNYNYRKTELLLLNNNETRKAELALSLMNEFVRSNERIINAHKDRSGDRDIGITDIVIDNKYLEVKTTYDRLVDEYVGHRVESGFAKIDADYCNRILSYFSAPASEPDPQITLINKVQESISEINDRFTKLYNITDQTIRDYNAYIASQAIFSMSGISLSVNMSSRLYLLIACFIGLSLGIIIALTIEIIKKIRYKSYEAL